MERQRTLQLTDIPWLRRAGARNGAIDVPQDIASKLLSGGFVQHDPARNCLIITTRGKLALERLT